MSRCVFCRIIKGELAGSTLYEDAEVISLLDLHPINEGHALVIPKRHVVSFTDLSEHEVALLGRAARAIASEVKAVLPCEGGTLSLADGEAAGQEVPHVHLHVIPRHRGGGFGWRFPGGYGNAADREKLEATATRLRVGIGAKLGG